MAQFHVIEGDGDQGPVSSWETEGQAQAAAGERNADWPNGDGPFWVVDDAQLRTMSF